MSRTDFVLLVRRTSVIQRKTPQRIRCGVVDLHSVGARKPSHQGTRFSAALPSSVLLDWRPHWILAFRNDGAVESHLGIERRVVGPLGG